LHQGRRIKRTYIVFPWIGFFIRFYGVLAHPLLLRAEEGAEVKANEASMSMKPSEARITPL
jgi:hypothetical protein